MTGELTLWLAFTAGVLSFISPCVLPLYPSYLSYITGVSVRDLQETNSREVRRSAVMHTLFFVIGLSIIYLALGFSVSLIGDFFYRYQDLIRQLGAILIIAMGLFLLGWLKLDFLMKEKRFELKSRPAGYLGSIVIGASFAAGWSPCVGPILAAILALSATNPDLGIYYMLLYIAGFAIPFLVLAFFLSSVRAILKYSNVLVKVGGVMMILMGVLLFTDQLTKITIYLNNIFGTSWF